MALAVAMDLLLSERTAGLASGSDRVLRRQIDRSVSRALCDRDFAERLLTDPTIALQDSGCPPQQYKSLRSIQAIDVVDFARQAHALFWGSETTRSYLEEQLPLAAGAEH
jgi:hypothetical protein